MITGAAAPIAVGLSSFGEAFEALLAPFHLVMLHFPIGFVFALACLEVVFWKRPRPVLRRATWVVALLTLASAIAASVLGAFRAEVGQYDGPVLGQHRLAGLAVCALLIGIVLVHALVLRRYSNAGMVLCYRMLLAAAVGTTVYAGHLGGTLTHGSSFLLSGAPLPVKEFLSESPDVSKVQPGAEAAAREVVRMRCLRCHGPEVQMGGLRLDGDLLKVRTRKSAPLVVPADPGRSELVRVVLLASAEEGAMPPAPLPRMSEEEVLVLLRWIQSSARPSARR